MNGFIAYELEGKHTLLTLAVNTKTIYISADLSHWGCLSENRLQILGKQSVATVSERCEKFGKITF